MKHVIKQQLKKCIVLGIDEFRSLINELTSGMAEVSIEDFEIFISETEHENDIGETSPAITPDYIKKLLSDYFDIAVTSYHSDSCDYIGVWIVYEEEGV